MEVSARITSKGQLTVPKSVREALHLEQGDHVTFRVQGEQAVMARTPDLIALGGTVRVPAAKRGTPWDQVLGGTRAARARTRR